MAQILKNNSKSVISERLYHGYQTAMQMPGHKSLVQLPTGMAVYVMVESKGSLKEIKDMFKEKQISNGHQITEKPLKRSKKDLELAQEQIKELVKANARELKKQGLTVGDVLKRMPKIRAQLIKERYGI